MVESVAVALPLVAVQIQMTLPALRSVRSRAEVGAGGCIYGIRLHQHPPAVSSQRHWEYLHVREIATGVKTKVPVLPSCAGGFSVFIFFNSGCCLPHPQIIKTSARVCDFSHPEESRPGLRPWHLFTQL